MKKKEESKVVTEKKNRLGAEEDEVVTGEENRLGAKGDKA